MVNVQLYANCLCKRYVATRCSVAYIFTIACTLLAIVVPYFLCFSPNYSRTSSSSGYPLGLWLKRDSYNEQAEVKFQYKTILVVQGTASSPNTENDCCLEENKPIEMYYSTMNSINSLKVNYRPSSVSYLEVDDDKDGLTDQLVLQFQMPLESNERVYGVQALVFVSYALQNHVKMSMDSLAYVRHDAGLPASSFRTRGDLVLRQNLPMRVKHTNTDLYRDDPLLDLRTASVDSSMTTVMGILEQYNTRELTTEFIERFPIWTRDINALNREDSKVFDLHVTIDIPKLQRVMYIPTLYEVLVEAWIRYLSLLVIAAIIARRILHFVFSSQIIKTFIAVDKIC